MARLELPTRSFVESFMRRAFPEYDWSQGSALTDLVVKNFAVILQPLRHEIDITKINQSLDNYAYMREADVDSLAANWGKVRQRGARAEGSVRLYFDTAADYSFTFLEFLDDAGTVYTLTAPVSITAQQLLAQRRSDGTFYFDVSASSVGIGDRYVVPAGAIRSLRNRPTNVVSVENIEPFRVTSPNESNYDVVNSLYRNLGLKNLVNRAAIRAPIYDTFPGVLDIYIAGTGDPKMYRDQRTVTVDGGNITYHAGGCADVWLNTNNVQTREVILTYLPSSGRVDFVDAEQAAARELVYNFTQGYLSNDGIFLPSQNNEDLDESMSVEFDGPVLSTVAKLSALNLWPLTATDILGGADLLALVSSTSFVDPVGPPLTGTAATTGDMASFESNQRRRMSALSGKVFEVTPEFVATGEKPVTTLSPAASRQLFVAGISSFGPNIFDPVIIASGNAAGEYVVTALNLPDEIWIGRPVGQVVLSNEVADGPGRYKYDVTGFIPTHVDSTFSVYSNPGDGDPGLDQTPSRWANVIEVQRTQALTQIVLNTTGFALPVAVTGGLAGNTAVGDRVIVGSFKSSTFTKDDSIGTLLYTNALPSALVAGTTTLSAVGVGLKAQPGDLVVFDGVSGLTQAQLQVTGGDGTVITAVIEGAVSSDQLKIFALGFDVPAGTAYAVVKNRQNMATATTTSVVGPLATYATFPLGLGDASGLVTVGPLKAVTVTLGGGNATIVRNVASNTASVEFPAGTLTPLFLRDTLVVTGAGALNGSYPVLAKTTTRVIVDASSNASFVSGVVATANCAFHRKSAMPIVGSSNTIAATRTLKFVPPAQTIKITTGAFGYQTPIVGSPVSQQYGAQRYVGVLKAVTLVGPNYVWEIAPNNTGVDLFTVSVTNRQAAYGVTLYAAAGDSTWVTLTGAPNIGSISIGDRVTIAGSVGHDGVFFVDSLDIPGQRVRIAASLSSAAGSGTATVDTVPFLQVAGGGRAQANVRDDNTGAFYSFGHTAATGADIGGTVTQGSYTGTLISYDNVAYTWAVQTLPSAIFDSISTPVTISTSAAGGTLQAPSTVSLTSLTNVTLTLPSTPAFLATEVVEFRSRFGSEGGLMESTGLKVNENLYTPFGSITNQYEVVVPNSDLLGRYPVTQVTSSLLTLANAVAGPLVRIANAPPAKALTIVGSLSLAGPALQITETDLGKWAGPGRVVQIKNGATVYNLYVASVISANTVQFVNSFPVTLQSTTRWTYEVLEGFVTPFAVVPAANFRSYRIYHQPDLGDTLAEGVAGSTVANSDIFSTPEPLDTLLGGVPLAAGEYYIQIDTGDDASLEPYKIVALISSSSVQLDTLLTGTAPSNVGYRVVRIPDPLYREGWFDGVITSPTQITLLESIPSHYNSQLDATVLVERHELASNTPLVLPRLGGSVTGSVLTLNTAPNTTADWTSGVGFATAQVGQYVRVFFRQRDQSRARDTSGSVLKTYNYYRTNEYMVLPVVKILSADQLDPDTLQVVQSLTVNHQWADDGLRYSAHEQTYVQLTGSTDAFAPIRIVYLTDPSVKAVDDYLVDPDTRILAASLMAKRMEVVSVNVSASVRTETTATAVANAISTYINTLRSTEPLTKVGIMKYLFDQGVVSYLDLDAFTMDVTYFPCEHASGPLVSPNVSEFFGAPTASYLAGNVSVTVLA